MKKIIFVDVFLIRVDFFLEEFSGEEMSWVMRVFEFFIYLFLVCMWV